MEPLVPPSDFTDHILIEDDASGSGSGSVTDFTAVAPLSYSNGVLSISNASATAAGIVNSGSQEIAGAKVFVEAPSTSKQLTSLPKELATKYYVDSRASVKGFGNIATITQHAEGDRYICQIATAPYLQHYIYTWLNAGWRATVPCTGQIIYLSDLTTFYIYNASQWVPLESELDHRNLQTIGSITHQKLDELYNKMNASTISLSGRLYIPSGVQFSSSAATLTAYDLVRVTLTSSGCIATNAEFVFQRVGPMITVCWPTLRVTSTGNDTLNFQIPSSVSLPKDSVAGTAYVIVEGSFTAGMILINSSGFIRFCNGINGAMFPASTAIGMVQGSVSWYV